MRQGSSGRRPRGRPNRKQHGNAPRSSTFDSNGPEGRIRGNAHQVYEKYLGLARDAASAGDRVAAESFFQHYFRILNDSTDPTPAEFNGEPRQRGDQQAGQQAGQQGRGPNGPAAPRVNGSGPQPDVEFPVDLPAAAQGEAPAGNGRDRSSDGGSQGAQTGDGATAGQSEGRGPRQRRRGRPPRSASEDDKAEAAPQRQAASDGDEDSAEADDGKTASV